MAPRDRVLVGVITAAHGIRGEVKLRSFTATPAAIADYVPLETTAGVKLEIQRMRAQKDGFIASFRGITDRTKAEALKGAQLFVQRNQLPGLEAGEVYVHDLIGRPVQLGRSNLAGEIIDVANYGAGDLIDVRIAGRDDTVLIPFAPPFVADASGEKILIDLPEGYLDLKETP